MKEIVTSEKFSWNWKDVVRSTATAFATAFIASFGQLIEAWIANPTQPFPLNKVSLILTLKVLLATFAGDMFRRYVKPSATVITITPPVTPKENV